MWGMVEGGREQGKLALNWVCFLGCRAGLIAVVCDWLLVHCNFSFFLFSGGQEDFILLGAVTGHSLQGRCLLGHRAKERAGSGLGTAAY